MLRADGTGRTTVLSAMLRPKWGFVLSNLGLQGKLEALGLTMDSTVVIYEVQPGRQGVPSQLKLAMQ